MIRLEGDTSFIFVTEGRTALGTMSAPGRYLRMANDNQDDAAAANLERIRRHMRILVDIGRIAAEKEDLTRLLDEIVIQVSRAVEIHHVKILQYRPRHADLLIVAGVGWNKGVVGSVALSAGLRSPPGRAYRTAEPVTVQDFSKQEGDYALSELLKEHGIKSLANVPVLIEGAAWGVLEVDSTTPRDFNQDTIEFLMAAGVTAGVFIRRFAEKPSEAMKLAAVTAEAINRDVRLREMQHRVKNNLQLVLSSIAIQKRRYSNEDAQRALDHVASRINAISLAHDQLSPSQEGQMVRLSDYLRALCSSLKQQTENVEIDLDLADLELGIDRAVPLGLILNEVATNSIKHAFGDAGGHINVSLRAGVGYGEARMTLSDNGKGFKTPAAGGSGLKLIQSLARQIGGSVVQESSEQGTKTSLTFPLIT